MRSGDLVLLGPVLFWALVSCWRDAGRRRVVSQTIIALSGLAAGIGLAFVITRLVTSAAAGADLSGPTFVVPLVLLWIVIPLGGTIVAARLAGMKWLPDGVDPAAVLAGIIGLVITVALFLLVAL